MQMDIEQKRHAGTLKRATAFVTDPKQIEKMEKGFDRALQLFHVSQTFYLINLNADSLNILARCRNPNPPRRYSSPSDIHKYTEQCKPNVHHNGV